MKNYPIESNTPKIDTEETQTELIADYNPMGVNRHESKTVESMEFLGMVDGVPFYRRIVQSDTLTKGTLRKTGVSVLYRATNTEENTETVITYNHDKKTVTKSETTIIKDISSFEDAVMVMHDYKPRN